MGLTSFPITQIQILVIKYDVIMQDTVIFIG